MCTQTPDHYCSTTNSVYNKLPRTGHSQHQLFIIAADGLRNVE